LIHIFDERIFMEQYISISALWIDTDDQLIEYRMELCNETCSVKVDYYGSADEFKELAQQLISFPKTNLDRITYKWGEKKVASEYLFLNFFCYELTGQTAIHVSVGSETVFPYSNIPYLYNSEFYMRTVPASINRFGKILAEWNPKESKKIEWFAE
jgi:hypothetical protein